MIDPPYRGAAAQPPGAVATAIVARIDELFAIDAEARRQELSMEARDILPRQQSRPLLDVIRQQIEAARFAALPGGVLAKAQLHPYPMGPADTLPGTPGTGVEQQLGGKLDARGGSGSKELGTHRKLAGWAEDRSYSFDRGKLS